MPGRGREEPLRASGQRAFDILRREVVRTVALPEDVRSATVYAWSSMHGLAMLLLDGRLSMLLDEAAPDDDRRRLVSEVAALLG